MLKTIGISPKVKLPAIALAVVGAAVALTGYLIGDTPTITAGVGIIGASGLGFGVGYSAAPGQVGIAPVVQPLEDILAQLESSASDGAKALELLKLAAKDAAIAPPAPATAPAVEVQA